MAGSKRRKPLVPFLPLLLLLLSQASAQPSAAPVANPTPAAVTNAPATQAPVTPAPQTQAPATAAPDTIPPVTSAPVTLPPATLPPATLPPATIPPATLPPATIPPATLPPVTSAPLTLPPATVPPLTQAPTLAATQAPTLPVTQAPTLPVTQAPTLPVTAAPTLPVTQAPTLPVTQAPVTLTPTLSAATVAPTLPPALVTPAPTKAATLPPVVTTTAPTPKVTIPGTIPPGLPTVAPSVTLPTGVTLPPTVPPVTTLPATPFPTPVVPGGTPVVPVTTPVVPLTAAPLASTLTPSRTPSVTNATTTPVAPSLTPNTANGTSTPSVTPSPTTNTNNGSSPSSGSKSSTSAWVIPVAVVGGVAAVGLVALGLVLGCCLKRRKRRDGREEQGLPLKDDHFDNGKGPVLPLYELNGGLRNQAPNRHLSEQSSAGTGVSPSPLPVSGGSASSRGTRGTGATAGSSRVRPFSLQELKEATNDFDPAHKLGAGGFGTVYRGVLTNGKEIAVKRSGNGQKDYSQFRNEVELLSRLHHRHLVGLLGYCDEGGEQMLVYEFMANGAITEHFKAEKAPLPWQSRLAVALGSARGLDYLHNWADPPIVHRDVKSDNILLDAEFNAKVADFGLSRLPPTAQTMTMSGIKGTFGYIDPNYAAGQPLTKKSDVYSFGVVLLQLVSGRLAVDTSRPQAEWSVVEWARPFLHEKRYTPLVDPRMGDYSVEELATLCTLIGRMLSRQASGRPHMSEVVRTIERLSASGTEQSTAFEPTYDEDDMAPLDMSQFTYKSSTQGSDGTRSSGSSSYATSAGYATSARTRRDGTGFSAGSVNPRSKGGDSRASRTSDGGRSDTWREESGVVSGQHPSTAFTRLQESRLFEGR